MGNRMKKERGMKTNSCSSFFSALVILTAATIATAQSSAARTPGKTLVFVGTYTNATSKGIYVFEFDPSTGSASQPKLAVETASPSFVAIHPSRRFLYATNELSNFQSAKSG